MVEYRYKATNEQGETVEGLLVSQSLLQAHGELKQRGLSIIFLESANTSTVAPGATARDEIVARENVAEEVATEPIFSEPSDSTSSSDSVELTIVPEAEATAPQEKLSEVVVRQSEAFSEGETDKASRLSEESAANIVEFLADTIDRELPLEQALRAAAAEAPARESRILTELSNRIAGGMPPAEAIQSMEHVLPIGLSALIRADGHGPGRGSLLTEYIQIARRRVAIRRSFMMQLIYPALLTISMVTLGALMTMFLMPSFKKIFDDFGSDLPALTELVLGISDMMNSPVFWVVFLIGSVLLLVLIVFLHRSKRLSAFSPVTWLSESAEWGYFCGLLSLLIRADHPLPSALRIVARSSHSPRVRHVSNALAEEIEDGYSPWETALGLPMPSSLRYAFRWAHNREAFTQSLSGLSELYGLNHVRLSRVLPVLIEPIMVCLMGFFVGTVVIAMFLPLIQLLNNLS